MNVGRSSSWPSPGISTDSSVDINISFGAIHSFLMSAIISLWLWAKSECEFALMSISTRAFIHGISSSSSVKLNLFRNGFSGTWEWYTQSRNGILSYAITYDLWSQNTRFYTLFPDIPLSPRETPSRPRGYPFIRAICNALTSHRSGAVALRHPLG